MQRSVTSDMQWLRKTLTYILNLISVFTQTRCSAIAERPRCRVHYSIRQK